MKDIDKHIRSINIDCINSFSGRSVYPHKYLSVDFRINISTSVDNIHIIEEYLLENKSINFEKLIELIKLGK